MRRFAYRDLNQSQLKNVPDIRDALRVDVTLANGTKTFRKCHLPRHNLWYGQTRRNRAVKPKIAVLSVITRHHNYTEGSEEANQQLRFLYMATLSFNNKIQFCRRQNYDLIVEDERILRDAKPGSNHTLPQWGKVYALKKWLPHYEWIMWIDIDALVMNFSHSVESVIELAEDKRRPIKKELVLTVQPSTDQFFRVPRSTSNLNTGVFFAKNTYFVHNFLDRVLAVTQNDTEMPYQEQDAISFLLGGTKEHYHTHRQRGTIEAVLEARRHVWVMREPSAYHRSGWHPRWNLYLYPSLQRFDPVKGHALARYWSFNASNPHHAVIHFVSCKKMARCLTWFEYYYRLASCRQPGGFWEPCTSTRGNKNNGSEPFACDRWAMPPRVYYPPEFVQNRKVV